MLAHHVARQIDPDGDGPAPSFVAQCDMINDEGGWMLVTPAILGAETKQEATDTQTTDARGGVVMRVYVSSLAAAAPFRPRGTASSWQTTSVGRGSA